MILLKNVSDKNHFIFWLVKSILKDVIVCTKPTWLRPNDLSAISY